MAGEKSLNQIKEVIAAPTNERSQESNVLNKPEQSFEQVKEKIESDAVTEGKATNERIVASSQDPVSPVLDLQAAAQRKQIESIMAENLAETYQGLTPDKQRQFKIVGEKTAYQINILLNESKVKVNKIINLIKSWLSILPGINKFFLEKEAKIKTDAIIQLKKGGEQ